MAKYSSVHRCMACRWLEGGQVVVKEWKNYSGKTAGGKKVARKWLSTTVYTDVWLAGGQRVVRRWFTGGQTIPKITTGGRKVASMWLGGG